MSVPVLLFASYADAFQARELSVPVELPVHVAELVTAMKTMPGGGCLPEMPVVAINQRVANISTLIEAGDEVALIPPVAGG